MICTLLMFAPFLATAQNIGSSILPSLATGVSINGPAVAYGDIIDFDSVRNIYVLSQFADDSHVYGVAVKNPPLMYTQGSSTVPVAKDGIVLVNVTVENGPIRIGDSIITSSLPGKGMRALASSTNPIGIAVESFGAEATSSITLSLNGTPIRAGTILVSLDKTSRTAVQALSTQDQSLKGMICIWACVPFGTLMRYLTAALISFGSVYLAFRTFMADAVNGVLSIGRNPRARASIQSMVVFNAVLSALLALAGLVAGIVILFIQL